MARFTGFDEVLSALYVDFDNIYTRFLEIDPEAARSFGSAPYRWVRWIENHALRILYGEGVRRRILKRMCYLNPQRYQEFRNPFIRSAFQVVDCPPLTSRGKTSTDIHLVMDCMDDLSHTTHFDEFIILSGDADFTPLLIRLQEHAAPWCFLWAILRRPIRRRPPGASVKTGFCSRPCVMSGRTMQKTNPSSARCPPRRIRP